MAGKLITLPLRVWFRSAQLLTRAAGGAAAGAFSVAARAAETVAPGRPSPAPAPHQPRAPYGRPPSHRHTETAPNDRRSERAPAPRVPAAPAPPAPPPAPEPLVEEPRHVSEEPELVRESAEPGAEDGAGASITVIEPWNGYAKLNAPDVIARTRNATPAELAAVRLYESRNRSRQTVLDAVDRQLKSLNGSGLTT